MMLWFMALFLQYGFKLLWCTLGDKSGQKAGQNLKYLKIRKKLGQIKLLISDAPVPCFCFFFLSLQHIILVLFLWGKENLLSLLPKKCAQDFSLSWNNSS